MSIVRRIYGVVIILTLGILSPTANARLPQRYLSQLPTTVDHDLSYSLRKDYSQIRSAYSTGRISHSTANRRTTKCLSKAFSPGGKRFACEFPRGFHVDLMREDISKVINNTFSGNKYNSHGFVRELKIINKLEAPDSLFQFLESGSRDRIKDGRLVEFDITAQHKKTGMKIAIESKDWNITSKADMEKAKNQIKKIAMRAKESGFARSIWINRQALSEPYRIELERYGAKHNFGIYDNVSTGKTAVTHRKAQHIDSVLAKESDHLNHRKAQHTDSVLAKEPHHRKYRKYRRMATRSLVVIGILYEGLDLANSTYKYNNGFITTKDYSIILGGTAGAVGGGVSGAYTGAFIGSCFGPGPGSAIGGVIGGIVGSVSGALAGSTTTAWAMDNHYEKLTEQERQRFMTYLLEHYEAKALPNIQPLTTNGLLLVPIY